VNGQNNFAANERIIHRIFAAIKVIFTANLIHAHGFGALAFSLAFVSMVFRLVKSLIFHEFKFFYP
jgi:O-antigen/teichoic acid export membrane protein